MSVPQVLVLVAVSSCRIHVARPKTWEPASHQEQRSNVARLNGLTKGGSLGQSNLSGGSILHTATYKRITCIWRRTVAICRGTLLDSACCGQCRGGSVKPA